MSWIELKLDLPQEKLEEISGYLFAQGCEGINITDDNIIIYFSKHRWSEEIRIGILSYIQEIIPFFSPRNIQILSISDQDWNKNWREYFKPIHVSSRIVIKPPWETYQQHTGEIVVTINPQMAFGTGHHESTQLVIRMIEKYIKNTMNVLDVGTGSGILAILAEKLGAESVVAIDDDPTALKNAYENAQLNALSNKVKFYMARPENIHSSQYDLVLANINRNVLIKYANLFPQLLNPKGILVISGILRMDEVKMLDVYEKAGFFLIEKNALKDWISLVFKLRDIKSKNEEKKALSVEKPESA